MGDLSLAHSQFTIIIKQVPHNCTQSATAEAATAATIVAKAQGAIRVLFADVYTSYQILCLPADWVHDVHVAQNHMLNVIPVQTALVVAVILAEQLFEFLWHKAALSVIYLCRDTT